MCFEASSKMTPWSLIAFAIQVNFVCPRCQSQTARYFASDGKCQGLVQRLTDVEHRTKNEGLGAPSDWVGLVTRALQVSVIEEALDSVFLQLTPSQGLGLLPARRRP